MISKRKFKIESNILYQSFGFGWLTIKLEFISDICVTPDNCIAVFNSLANIENIFSIPYWPSQALLNKTGLPKKTHLAPKARH